MRRPAAAFLVGHFKEWADYRPNAPVGASIGSGTGYAAGAAASGLKLSKPLYHTGAVINDTGANGGGRRSLTPRNQQ